MNLTQKELKATRFNLTLLQIGSKSMIDKVIFSQAINLIDTMITKDTK